jgi:hypothetical protein
MVSQQIYHLSTPIGTAIIGPATIMTVGTADVISTMMYSSLDGLRVWLEDGNMHQFEGNVCVRGTNQNRITVNVVEGQMLRVFNAIDIFAITPARGNPELMRAVLKTALHNRALH